MSRLTFPAWLEELAELARENGLAHLGDLRRFQPEYEAGQAPADVLEELARQAANMD